VELLQPAARVLELLLGGLAHFLRTGRIDQNAHFDACAGPGRKRIRHSLAQDALFPQEALEMNRMLRGSDFVNQHIEEGAVFEDLDAVALDRRTERKTR
jgi:hypothetical protein